MISFFVPGTPVAKGSAKAFYNRNARKIVTMQDNGDKQKPWASMISYCAQEKGFKVSSGGFMIYLMFRMPRPKSHYGTGKNSSKLKDNAPDWHTGKPDLDKLVRCVKDALTGIVWKDDSQVSFLSAGKIYSEKPGVKIEVGEVF